jgi:hypothetical protein
MMGGIGLNRTEIYEDWKEIEATHKAVCDEPRGRTTKTRLSPKP